MCETRLSKYTSDACAHVSTFVYTYACACTLILLQTSSLPMHLYQTSTVYMMQTLFIIIKCAGDDADVKRADTEAEAKKRMRAIGFPGMDADGLPSAYSLKVTVCLGKWVAKIAAFEKDLETVTQSDKLRKLLDFRSPPFPCSLECWYI